MKTVSQGRSRRLQNIGGGQPDRETVERVRSFLHHFHQGTFPGSVDEPQKRRLAMLSGVPHGMSLGAGREHESAPFRRPASGRLTNIRSPTDRNPIPDVVHSRRPAIFAPPLVATGPIPCLTYLPEPHEVHNPLGQISQ